MPNGNMSSMMMDEGPETEQAAAPPPEEPAEDVSEETPPEAAESTAELPRSVLGGQQFKPGDEVVLQVVKVMEDSVLVKYGSAEEDETAEEEPEPPTSEMASLME